MDLGVDADLLALIRGEPIAEGCSRRVYKYNPDTSFVIKEEKAGYKFDNITEWEMWSELKETPYGNWMARCLTISPLGLALIQERTQRVPEALLPKMIPSIFFDVKAENWGMVMRRGKKLYVCHDYAHSRVMNVPKKIKLVPAKWHNPEYAGWIK